MNIYRYDDREIKTVNEAVDVVEFNEIYEETSNNLYGVLLEDGLAKGIIFEE